MNFDDFEEVEPLTSEIPDTIEELLEEWEKADEVKEAKKAKAEAEAEAAAIVRERDEMSDELSDIAKQIQALQRKENALKNKIFNLRGRTNRAAEVIRRADQVVSVAKSNYEKSLEQAQKLSVLDAEVKDLHWYKGFKNEAGTLFKVKKHQILGGQFIGLYNRVILADEMGTGKTLTLIGAMDYAKAKRVLVVTPADVASNFVNEIKMWAPHRNVINMKGLSRAERRNYMSMLSFMTDFVIVTNYESWRRDIKFIDELIEQRLDMVICDEAHVMKNLKSNAYSEVQRLVHATNACPECGAAKDPDKGTSVYKCAKCEFSNDPWASGSYVESRPVSDFRSVKTVVPATGTPILNSPEDLFSLLNLIEPETFNNLYDYLYNYAERDLYTNKWTFKSGGAESLLKRLGSKFLRRTMVDIGIDLPEQTPIKHSLTFEDYKLQEDVYRSVTEYGEFLLNTPDEFGEPRKITVSAMIALITRQRQATVWPAGIEIKDPDTHELLLSVGEDVQESVKIDKAMELIEQYWTEDKRIVVFSQFATGLAELEKRLSQTPIRAVRLDGSTPDNVKNEIKTNFDRAKAETPKWDVVLANYKTGGVGLNLTACQHMIILDQEWNPGKEDQALARILRIGQTEKTFVHILEVEGTVDVWMRALIEDKRGMISGFNSDQKSLQDMWLSEFGKATKKK